MTHETSKAKYQGGRDYQVGDTVRYRSFPSGRICTMIVDAFSNNIYGHPGFQGRATVGLAWAHDSQIVSVHRKKWDYKVGDTVRYELPGESMYREAIVEEKHAGMGGGPGFFGHRTKDGAYVGVLNSEIVTIVSRKEEERPEPGERSSFDILWEFVQSISGMVREALDETDPLIHRQRLLVLEFIAGAALQEAAGAMGKEEASPAAPDVRYQAIEIPQRTARPGCSLCPLGPFRKTMKQAAQDATLTAYTYVESRSDWREWRDAYRRLGIYPWKD